MYVLSRSLNVEVVGLLNGAKKLNGAKTLPAACPACRRPAAACRLLRPPGASRYCIWTFGHPIVRIRTMMDVLIRKSYNASRELEMLWELGQDM